MKKTIIVGSLNMDLVINAPYAPRGGETLLGSGFMTNCGGKGANQAYAVARLGGKAYMCGCVGSDPFGRQLKENLNSVGVDTSFVRCGENTPSGVAVIVVTQGENRIILDSGANAKLCCEDIDRVLEIAEEGDVYLTQLENPIEVIGYGLKKAKEKGLITVLNPAPANKDILKYAPFVDIITPNETESELLGGRDTLFALGIKTVITTLGARGYEIATKEESHTCPAIKVTPVDTTAAGDTACGGLCAMLSQGYSLDVAMRFGSIAASIACTRKGAQMSVPTEKEVRDFMEKNQ